MCHTAWQTFKGREKWSQKTGQIFRGFKRCFGLCRYGQRFSFVEYVIGRSSVNS